MSKKPHELTEEELAQVSGGTGNLDDYQGSTGYETPGFYLP